MNKIYKSILKISLLVIISFFPIINAQAQEPEVEWSRFYHLGPVPPGTGFYFTETGTSVHQVGAGYIIGARSFFPDTNADVSLIKTDLNGNKIWDKTFKRSGFDNNCGTEPTSDAGYIILSSRYSYGYGLWLIKTDANGNKQWDTALESQGTYRGQIYSSREHAVRQTSDGGFIITGTLRSSSNYKRSALLIKTDSNGNKEWYTDFGDVQSEQKIVESEYIEGFSVQQTSDSGYIIAGWAAIPFLPPQGLLIKTDSQGRLQWHKILPFGQMTSVQQTPDSGYIVTGVSQWGTHLIKTDANGNKIWDKTLASRNSNFVSQTDDGGYLVVGGGRDLWIAKTDSNGNQQWEKLIGGYYDEGGYAALQTADGGYTVVGYTLSDSVLGQPTSKYGDVWLLKLKGTQQEKGLKITEVKTNKSFYLTNEEVKISCVVTDTTGVIISQATVTAEITQPDGVKQLISFLEATSGKYEGTFTNASLEGIYNLTIKAEKTGYVAATATLSFEVIIPKIPLGGSISGEVEGAMYKIYIPDPYGGTLTVKTHKDADLDLYYPDTETKLVNVEKKTITEEEDGIQKEKLSLTYEIPFKDSQGNLIDNHGWYYLKVVKKLQGVSSFKIENTFIQKGEVPEERKPWNISTWWPFSDVNDDGVTIKQITNLYDDNGPLRKYDLAVYGSEFTPATDWEKGKSYLENPWGIDGIRKRILGFEGHYIYNKWTREKDYAETDWKYDWNRNGLIEKPASYDFYSDTEGFTYPDSDLDDKIRTDWWGHCDGWAKAAIIFKNPADLGLKAGFEPEEVKGLLTEIGMRRLDEPESIYLLDKKGDYVYTEQEWTKVFHNFLRFWLRKEQKSIYGNLGDTERKTNEVWNHPIWYYAAEMKERNGDEKLVDVILTLKAADDLGRNFREGNDWKYHLEYAEKGNILPDDSGWDTTFADDINTKYYIPYLIHPRLGSDVFKPESGRANPYVTEDKIKEFIVDGEIRRDAW